MLTIEQCDKILKSNGDIKYTKDEIRTIREFLYLMAQLQVESKLK